MVAGAYRCPRKPDLPNAWAARAVGSCRSLERCGAFHGSRTHSKEAAPVPFGAAATLRGVLAPQRRGSEKERLFDRAYRGETAPRLSPLSGTRTCRSPKPHPTLGPTTEGDRRAEARTVAYFPGSWVVGRCQSPEIRCSFTGAGRGGCRILHCVVGGTGNHDGLLRGASGDHPPWFRATAWASRVSVRDTQRHVR